MTKSNEYSHRKLLRNFINFITKQICLCLKIIDIDQLSTRVDRRVCRKWKKFKFSLKSDCEVSSMLQVISVVLHTKLSNEIFLPEWKILLEFWRNALNIFNFFMILTLPRNFYVFYFNLVKYLVSNWIKRKCFLWQICTESFKNYVTVYGFVEN